MVYADRADDWLRPGLQFQALVRSMQRTAAIVPQDDPVPHSALASGRSAPLNGTSRFILSDG